MTCAEAEPLLGACLDGEVDARTVLEIAQHLSRCRACSAISWDLERLHKEIASANLDLSAGADLRPLRAAIRRKNRPAWWRITWVKPAALAFAASLLLFTILPNRIPSRTDDERQVIDNHIRALMADHLIDVPSSDRHTVKPWFQGKLNFAPIVPDLSNEGFVLIGGRLDVIDGKQAAAIVYKRQNHIINLWMFPASNTDQEPETRNLDGYHLVRWKSNAMAYRAVSDVNVAELKAFADLVRSQ